MRAGERGADDRGEGDAALADAAEQLEHVPPQGAGVGSGHRVDRAVVRDGGHHELILARPAPVEDRHPGPGPEWGSESRA